MGAGGDPAATGAPHGDAPRRQVLPHLQAGDGPDVVLVHGALTTAADMEMALFPALSRRHRVTAFDRAGHEGGHRGHRPGGSPQAHASLLRESIVALGLRRPVIVGHSFGGAVALSHALRFPDEVAGVVAVAPIVFPELRPEHLLFAPRALPGIGIAVDLLARSWLDPVLLPALRRLMFSPQPVPEGYDARVPGSVPGRMLQAEAEDAAFLVPGLALNSMSYVGCAVPLTVLAGTADAVVDNRRHGRLLSRVMARADYVELAGTGHMAHHFAQAEVLRAVERLCRR